MLKKRSSLPSFYLPGIRIKKSDGGGEYARPFAGFVYFIEHQTDFYYLNNATMRGITL